VVFVKCQKRTKEKKGSKWMITSKRKKMKIKENGREVKGRVEEVGGGMKRAEETRLGRAERGGGGSWSRTLLLLLSLSGRSSSSVILSRQW
jgi:hypothetical protein